MKLRLSRRTSGQDVPDSGQHLPDSPAVPWWVSVFTDFGRPLAAIVVLVLCAPGEHHLAELAGWSGWLSWGMAGLFSLYAGVAAVVATVRPKGAPGKTSAVWGAVVSLLLAMGAQPVSHLFVTGWLTADPRAPWLLVVIVSCVPPFILGHLLHLAASPSRPVRPAEDRTVLDPADSKPVSRPAVRTAVPSRPADAPSRPAAVPAVRPVVSLDKRPVRPALSAGQDTTLKTKQNLSARALELLRAGHDKDSARDMLVSEFTSPDGQAPKPDSIRKALARAEEKLSA